MAVVTVVAFRRAGLVEVVLDHVHIERLSDPSRFVAKAHLLSSVPEFVLIDGSGCRVRHSITIVFY